MTIDELKEKREVLIFERGKIEKRLEQAHSIAIEAPRIIQKLCGILSENHRLLNEIDLQLVNEK